MTSRGAIAASDPQTAEAGATVLAQGGNAVDAIVAAAFASFVAEPPLTSPAGGGALLHGSVDAGWTLVDCMACTPGRGLVSRPDLDFFAIEVDFGPTTQAFHVGRGSVAVPGLLPGLVEAHQRSGSLPLKTVLEPAIHLARSGFVLSVAIHRILETLTPILELSDALKALLYRDGALAPAGTRLTNPDLGDFLEAVARDPAGARRDLERAMVAGFGPTNGGLLTQADLDAWRPEHRPPLRVPWRGHEVLLNPPPAAGGGLVGFSLRLSELVGLDGLPFLGPEHLGRVARILERTSAFRGDQYEQALGDRARVEALLDDANVARWLSGPDARQERHLGSTTHVSVADGRGGAASLTTSNGEGCGTVLPGFGVHLNNFLGEADINPLGFHVAPPGERMATMMSPTIALRDGAPVLVLGSGGANRIRTAVFQALVNRLVFDRPIDESVNAPRIHVEGDRLWFESVDLEPEAAAALERALPEAIRFDHRSLFFGGVHAVALDHGRWRGAGDRRRGGAAR